MQLWSECCVIGIGGDPLGSTFKGEGCQISIWNEIAGGIRPRTQLRKEPPVARPRHDADCSRRLPDLVGEGEGGGEGTGWSENSRMRHDADEGAQDQFTDEKVDRSSQYLFEPSPIEQMAGRILAMSINEDVDVAQDHAPSAQGHSKNPASNDCDRLGAILAVVFARLGHGEAARSDEG